MYIYATPPVDFFGSLCPLNQIVSINKMGYDSYDFKSWMMFIWNALRTIKSTTDWSPSKLGIEIYVGSIPKPYDPVERFIVIKQAGSGDNGATFIGSETPLIHLEEFYIDGDESIWKNQPIDEKFEDFINYVISRAALGL